VVGAFLVNQDKNKIGTIFKTYSGSKIVIIIMGVLKLNNDYSKITQLAGVGLLVLIEGFLILKLPMSIPTFLSLFCFALSALHSISASFYIYDLLTKSKRPNKSLWFFMLLTLPLIGILMYCMTMKRNKPYRSYSHFV